MQAAERLHRINVSKLNRVLQRKNRYIKSLRSYHEEERKHWLNEMVRFSDDWHHLERLKYRIRLIVDLCVKAQHSQISVAEVMAILGERHD